MKAKKTLKILSPSLAALALLLSPTAVFAASATESLISAGSVTKGSYITVTIKENSGSEPVNAASATLSYPTNLLSYVSISNSSAFSIVASSSGGSGSVKVDRGALPAVSGNQTVASVVFKALTDSGTASVGITSGSVLSANTNGNIYSGGSGTSIALKPVPPPAVAPPKDTTPPTITAVNVSQITSTSALVSWTTSEPATSEVDYGPTQSYGLAASDGQLVIDHKITLNSPLILPASLYHVIVRSADAAGNTSSSSDSSFTTLGGTISITLVDQKNKPLVGAKVSLLDATGTTNKQGIAVVKGIQTGKQSLIVKYRGNTYTQTITVGSFDSSGQAKSAKYSIKVSSSNLLVPLFIILLFLSALIWWLSRKIRIPASFMHRLNLKFKPMPSPTAPQNQAKVINPTSTDRK